MQTEEFKASLQELIELSKATRIAIMCAESLPWRCHRSLIADAMTVRGLKVEHIISQKSSHEHKMTPFARMERDNITYPAPSE